MRQDLCAQSHDKTAQNLAALGPNSRSKLVQTVARMMHPSKTHTKTPKQSDQISRHHSHASAPSTNPKKKHFSNKTHENSEKRGGKTPRYSSAPKTPIPRGTARAIPGRRTPTPSRIAQLRPRFGSPRASITPRTHQDAPPLAGAARPPSPSTSPSPSTRPR